MKLTLIYLAIFFLAACSNRSVYDGFQASNRLECTKAPPASYDECVAKTYKSYEEYERERKEVVED